MAPRTALAVGIQFDGGAVVITDNGLLDGNPAIGTIDFDSIGSNPFTIASGYDVKGTVQNTAGPSLSSLIAPITGAVTLTNFVADRPLSAIGGITDIEFFDTVIGSALAVTVADIISAEVANGNGAATYLNNASGNPVPASQDTITTWQGFISGAIITNQFGTPPPIPNPNLPAGGGTLAYPVFGHGPTLIPGPFVNPVIGAFFSFQLGGVRDQLILPSSAEVGFTAVPEPSTAVLAIVGLVGFALYGRKRRGTVLCK
jgi:hypothetical protein